MRFVSGARRRRSIAVLVVATLLAGCQAETPPPSGSPAATAGGGTTPLPAASPGASPAASDAAVAIPTPAGSPGDVSVETPGPIPAAEVRMPGSRDRILAALDEGRIDEPTALLYRVYALFGDARLPGEYVTDRWEEDAGAMAAAAAQLDTLPPEIAAELRPFVARPTDPVSVWHDVAAAATDGATADAPVDADGSVVALPARTATYVASDFVCEADGWGYVAERPLVGPVAWKVWTGCTDAAGIAQAVQVAGFLERLFGKETALLGMPVRDAGGPNEAGDGPLDVYLVNQCMARSGRCMGSLFAVADKGAIAYATPASPWLGAAGARKASGFIVFKRSFMGANTESSLAHELFHVLQFAHNATGTAQGGVFHWFLDATAKWAEHFFVPAGRPGNVYPWLSTHQGTAQGLNDETGVNAYASFVWPLFMQQELDETAIADAWTAIEGKRNWQQVDRAIDSVLPFETSLRDAEVRLWNQPLRPAAPDPIDPRFQGLDPQLPQTGPWGGRYSVWDVLPANPPGTPPRQLPESMPALSGRYTRFGVDPKVQQIILDFAPLNPASQVDVNLLLRIRKTGWEEREVPTGRTKLCLTDPEDEVVDMIVVLTNHELDRQRPVNGHWTVESLKEPCIGWDVHIEWTDEYDGIRDTITFEGVVDTYDQSVPPDPSQPDPPAFLTGTGTASGRRAGWKACNPGIPDVPGGSGKAVFGATLIDDRIYVSAFTDISNPLNGVTTAIFDVPVEGGTVSIPRPTPVGDLCPHASYGTITVTPAPDTGP